MCAVRYASSTCSLGGLVLASLWRTPLTDQWTAVANALSDEAPSIGWHALRRWPTPTRRPVLTPTLSSPTPRQRTTASATPQPLWPASADPQSGPHPRPPARCTDGARSDSSASERAGYLADLGTAATSAIPLLGTAVRGQTPLGTTRHLGSEADRDRYECAHQAEPKFDVYMRQFMSRS